MTSGKGQPTAASDPVPFYLAEQTYDPAIPVADLHEHPKNYNKGDTEAIAESLDAHGFYGAVIAQASTGLVIAGNHRYRVAVSKGAATIPGFRLDCTDDEAEAILANDNLTSSLAKVDEGRLIGLLTSVRDQRGDTRGTGYSADALAILVRHHASVNGSAQDLRDEWDDMPEFDQPNAKPAFSMTVHFPTAGDAQRFFTELLGLDEVPRTRFIWWPQHDGFKGWDTHNVIVADQ